MLSQTLHHLGSVFANALAPDLDVPRLRYMSQIDLDFSDDIAVLPFSSSAINMQPINRAMGA